MSATGQGTTWLSAVEIFSGVGSIARGFRHFGFDSIPVDAKYATSPPDLHDILSPVGLCFILGLLLRLRPGSALWLAPVCSTWLWCSRSKTLRCWTLPHGCEDTAGVWEANVAVARLEP